MTKSRDERSANFQLVLQTMLDSVGDSALDEVAFDPTAHPAVLTTTWDELLAKELIESLPTGEHIFTGRGWTAALLSTGRINDDAFKTRIEKLFSALKSLVKGRHGSATVSLQAVVDQTGLPQGWVFNIIEGRYAEEVSKRRGASWVKPGRLILIPVAFGIEPTDLRTLVDPAMLQKMEDLQHELESSRDDLSRYRCPHCNAEMTATGGYPIDERNDGDYEQFSCGFGRRDGRVDSLCPDDPHFPKFDEFEFFTHQNERGEWTCWARGKTALAKLVHLDSCPGCTEDEARRRVALRYAYAAGKKRDITSEWVSPT